MKTSKTLGLAAVLGAAVALGGCAAGPSMTTGYWYTDQSGPVIATGEHAPSKVGTATATSILGLIGTGDASINEAMQNGGISRVHHVDFHTRSILGLFAETQVMVYGQ